MASDIVPFHPPQPSGDTYALAPEAWKLSNKVANTEFVPKALRGKPEAVLACILAGHEAGLSPMTSLRSIHVIEGRPAMSAELMRAVIQRAGHTIEVEEMSTTRAVVVGKRSNSERPLRVVWTEDDARRAGLLGKDNWKKYPRAMLVARATTELARMLFPDVLAGISHSIEELADGGAMDGPLEHLGPPEQNPQETATAAPAPRTAQARRAATPPNAAPDGDQMAPMTRPNQGPAPALPGEEDIVDAEIVEEVAEAVTVDLSTDSNIIRETLDEMVDEILERHAPAGSVAEPDNPQVATPAGPRADEIVDPPDDGDDWEGDPDPPPADPGPRLTGAQIIAMRLNDHGIRDRTQKLRWVGHIIGRELGTTNDLTSDEVRTVIAWLDQLAPGEVLDPIPDTDAPKDAEPIAPAARTVAVTPPEEWNGDRWREFLKARKLKVAPVLKEAQRLGAERTPPIVPAMLDDLAGSGICADLIGWCEDQS